MRKDFYIFRHGETAFNAQRRMQGSGTDMGLTELGKKQAFDLAEKLCPCGVEAVFSSPLKRALETAEVVACAAKCDVFVKNDLRECFYGDAEGMPVKRVCEKFSDVYKNWNDPEVWDIAYPNGESKRTALHRIWFQIEELKQQPYQVMGIAMHGGTMASLLNFLHHNFKEIPNCAVIHLVYDNDWYIDGDLF